MGSEFLTSPFDNLLKPVDDHLIVHNELMSSLILGNKIQIIESLLCRLTLNNCLALFALWQKSVHLFSY